MNARPAAGERIERGERGELTAADREAEAVAGHRVDEAGGVAGEQQPVGRARASRRRRAGPARRAARPSRAGGAAGEQGVARELAGQQRGGVGEASGSAGPRVARGRRWSGRRAPARHRYTVRVECASRRTSGPYRARLGRTRARHVPDWGVLVPGTCQAPMTGQNRRSTHQSPIASATRGDAPGRARMPASDRRPSAAMVTARRKLRPRGRARSPARRRRDGRRRPVIERAANADARLEPAARGDRVRHQQPIEIAPEDRSAPDGRPDTGPRPRRRGRR